MIIREQKDWVGTYPDKDGLPTRVYARATDRNKETVPFEYAKKNQEEIKRDHAEYLLSLIHI